ncbi:MAG TPA: ABC transporter substrate-binding protein, partial [Desulfosarcina sp.]|nr:ABC transporter substrate-binding protein [Desulfosarcina sp.]
ALAETNLTTGPAMIASYDAIAFDETGQNKHASLSIVQINDLGNGLERITVWPKGARRAGYTPVFPVAGK